MKRMDECADPDADGASASAESAVNPWPTAPASAPVRVVARVVDPLVREDGRGDPQFTTEVGRERPARSNRPPVGGTHPVRDRLLAKARAAIEVANVPPGEEPEPQRSTPVRPARAPAEGPFFGEGVGEPARVPTRAEDEAAFFESLPEVADDLDLIGAPQRPRPQRRPHAGPALPASTTLLLGTLGGLVSIAALFAGLIHFAPRDALQVAPALVAVEAAPPVADDTVETEPAPAVVGKVQRPPRTRAPGPGPWRIDTAAADANLTRVHGSVGDRSFLGSVQTAGVSLKDAYRVLTAFSGVKNLDRCRPKDTFTGLIDAKTGRLSAFEYAVSEEEVYQARAGDDGRLTARKLDLDVQRHRAQGVVVLDGSFEDAARRAGFEPGLGDYVNKALSAYVSTTDFKAGDVLGIVAQEVTVAGDFSRYAGVEALEYRPVGGEPLRVYYHEASRGYVDSKGRVFGKSRWTRPVPGAGVTSRYNPKRMHPILKRIKPHNGTDFGSPVGTPVVAAAAGKVSFVGRAGPNGNMVTIAHAGGYQTGYSHLSRFVKGLKVGASVEQKQLVGYVGSTGRSTGPHLHFSAKKNGRFIDPETLNLDGMARLTQDQRLGPEQRRRYDRMLDAMHMPEARPPRAVPRPPAPEPPREAKSPFEVEIAAARAAPNAATPAATPVSAPPAVNASTAPVASTAMTSAPAATADAPTSTAAATSTPASTAPAATPAAAASSAAAPAPPSEPSAPSPPVPAPSVPPPSVPAPALPPRAQPAPPSEPADDGENAEPSDDLLDSPAD